jgi:hypothetical protein
MGIVTALTECFSFQIAHNLKTASRDSCLQGLLFLLLCIEDAHKVITYVSNALMCYRQLTL